MELDLQSLFGLHVHSCTHWPKPRNSPLPPGPPPHISPHLGSYMRALLVSQDRRHLFVTPALGVAVGGSCLLLISGVGCRVLIVGYRMLVVVAGSRDVGFRASVVIGGSWVFGVGCYRWFLGVWRRLL
jgi:hypothetical protein